MFNDFDQQEDFDNDDAGRYAQEQNEQERWEEENNVDSLLSNDPGYTAWADEMDRQTAEDREIMDLAAIEDERKFNTLSAWD